MKTKLILFIVLMTIIPVLTSAQAKSGDDSAPTNTGTPDSLLQDAGPTIVPAGPGPLGSQEFLQEYQTVMVAITQNFSANLAGITGAVQQGTMTSEEGKTSSTQQYLMAQMQFQLLSAWRQMDKQDQAKVRALDEKKRSFSD